MEILDLAEASGLSSPPITILEGFERVGGRIRAEEVNGHIYNMGANWLHGGPSNPFYQWVMKRYPRIEAKQDRVANLLTVTQHGHDWEEAWGADHRERNMALLASAWAAFQSEHPETDLSLGELVSRLNDPGVAAVASFMARSWMAVETPDLVSCADFFSNPNGPGGMQLTDGLENLVKIMANELIARGVEIVTDCVIEKVRQDRDRVDAITADGSIFTADRIIVTASAGVLKADRIAFDPPLSAEIRSALDDLTMANMTKLVIPLSSSFLDQMDIPENLNIDVLSQELEVFCYGKPGGASAIAILVGGSKARFLEGAAETQVAEFADHVLCRISLFDGYKQHISGRILVTGWNRDPLILGSYTGLRVGGRRRNPIVQGRMILAGEAFVADATFSPSQMAGAWASGRLAARLALPTASDFFP